MEKETKKTAFEKAAEASKDVKKPEVKEVKPEIKEEIVETNDEVVTMKKSELDSLMERLKRVEFASSKAHLAKYDEKDKKDPGKTIKLRMIDGKVVIGWSDMITNDCEKNQNGVWKEDQKVEILYEDGKKEIMDFITFNKRYTQIETRVLSETKSADGSKITYKLTTDDGREYDVDDTFAN